MTSPEVLPYAKNRQRCGWVSDSALYEQYHDQEWGVPCRDDQTLFEFLILESAQAGLSWITILRKRENYRAAFAAFNVEKVARFNAADIKRLMNNAGIVRNRMKIESAISNAQHFIALQESYGSFHHFLWRFVEGKPVQNNWQTLEECPATTPLSDKISKDMKKRGFRFFGSTTCYAYLQAMGIVNDHTRDCFRHKACAARSNA